MSDLIFTEEREPEDRPDFPKNGFKFEVWCSKLPDCDDAPFVIKDLLPLSIKEASSYDLFPGSLSHLDSHFWVDTELVNEPGLWKLDCETFYDSDYDWESGHTETTLYINILEATKV